MKEEKEEHQLVQLPDKPEKVSKEVVKSALSVELIRDNYEKLLQDAENITFTKEELVELLSNTIEGWEESQDDSQYLPMGGNTSKRPTKEQYINNLFNS